MTSEQRKAFADMLRPHYDYLGRFCRHLVVSEDDGKDLCQQAILKALLSMDTLRDHGRFRQWMCSIIVHEHRNFCRRERLRRFLGLSGGHGDGDRDRMKAEPMVEPVDAVQSIRLRRCLQRLSPKKREAVVMFEVQGFALAEIAAIQHCSVDAVKARVSRARRELRALYCNGKPAAALRPINQECDHALRVSTKAVE